MEVTDSSKQSEIRAGLGLGACGSGLARALTLSERKRERQLSGGWIRCIGGSVLSGTEAINLLQKRRDSLK